MLNSIIDSIETKLYAVYDDLSYKEVNSIETGFNSRPKPYFIILKQNKGKTKSFFNDEFFAHSQYTFYDKTLKPTTINISDWVLLKVNERENRSREVIYSISDPFGKIREISNLSLNKYNWSEYFQTDGICRIIEFIRKISKYPNWSYYDLMKENELLKKTLDELTLEISRLKEKIKEIEENNK